MGPGGQRTPHVIDSKQSSGAARCWHGQSSPTTRLPAVTSTLRDLLDLAHLLSHLAGPIVDGKDDGGGNGGAARRDDGETSAMTSAAQPKVRTSNYERWGT